MSANKYTSADVSRYTLGLDPKLNEVVGQLMSKLRFRTVPETVRWLMVNGLISVAGGKAETYTDDNGILSRFVFADMPTVDSDSAM